MRPASSGVPRGGLRAGCRPEPGLGAYARPDPLLAARRPRQNGPPTPSDEGGDPDADRRREVLHALPNRLERRETRGVAEPGARLLDAHHVAAGDVLVRGV